MRKAAPLLLVLMTLFSLPAQQQVQSNSIGQDRGRFVEEGEYTLGIQGNESTLYQYEKPLWKETKTLFEDGFELVTYFYDDGSTHMKSYENNRLISETIGSENRYYYYDQAGLLEKTMLLVSDKLTQMELYTYDATRNNLNSILTITEKGSHISYFGDPSGRPWFSYTDDEVFSKTIQISQDLQIEEVWEGETLIKSVVVEFPQEGGIHLTTTRKGLKESELYDDEGLLVLRISPSLTTEYRYNDERGLIEAIEKSSQGNNVRIIRYEEGRMTSELIYMNDTLEKEILYPEDSGKVETLYDNGHAYCDITYALDGKRVLSIRYR